MVTFFDVWIVGERADKYIKFDNKWGLPRYISDCTTIPKASSFYIFLISFISSIFNNLFVQMQRIYYIHSFHSTWLNEHQVICMPYHLIDLYTFRLKEVKLVDDQLENIRLPWSTTHYSFGRMGHAMQINAIAFGHGHIRENS